MASAVKARPDGYQSVIPYLTVKGAAKLIDFLKQVFDAVENERMTGPDGTIRHAQVRLGDCVVMMGEANEEWKATPGQFYLYLDDVDATYQKALSAGAVSIREPATHFYGDRSAGVSDSHGNVWWLATHVEDVSPEEMERRMAAQS